MVHLFPCFILFYSYDICFIGPSISIRPSSSVVHAERGYYMSSRSCRSGAAGLALGLRLERLSLWCLDQRAMLRKWMPIASDYQRACIHG